MTRLSRSPLLNPYFVEHKDEYIDLALQEVNVLRDHLSLEPVALMPQGRRLNAFQCPVARCFTDGVSGYVGFSHGGIHTEHRGFAYLVNVLFFGGNEYIAKLSNNLTATPHHIYRIENPPHIARFVSYFDDGGYPELEAIR